MQVQHIGSDELAGDSVWMAELRRVPLVQLMHDDQMQCLDGAELIELEADESLQEEGARALHFYFLLSGQLRVMKSIPGGGETIVAVSEPGVTFGETSLLSGYPNVVSLRAITTTRLVRIDETAFWNLMAAAPAVRAAILTDMSHRSVGLMNTTMHQAKMASLGILAAGLMHELNNPGSAAKRAASQLRQNLLRMHSLSARFAEIDLSHDQKQCMQTLQEHALAAQHPVQMNSLEQSDAEEALAEWMEEAHIADAWRLAPTLVATGIHAEELECARTYFPAETFSDAVSWLEALSSSMQLVGVVEESIGRVSDLVHAVKSYAYEGKGQKIAVDINHSIHATIVILGHKFREKQIEVTKEFGDDLPMLESDCQGLNQIWTNLLDNAIDAVGQHGHITVRTWAEPDLTSKTKGTTLCVAVADDGEGIAPEVQPHIFDPFYTTKEVGVGTGLGLGIVHRIVSAYKGSVTFRSERGATEFLVRLPSKASVGMR